jgi:hypothetical protein
MANGPPWEWVDGDPVRASWYSLIGGVFLTVGSVCFAFVVLSLLGFPDVTFGIRFWRLDSWIFVLPLLGFEYFFLLYIPRWIPVVARIGLSPIGVRLVTVIPIRSTTVDWTDVKSVGRDWIEVYTGFLTLRYSLTLNQAQQVRRFLGVGEAARQYPRAIVGRPT